MYLQVLTVQSFITIKWQVKTLSMIKIFKSFVSDHLKPGSHTSSTIVSLKIKNAMAFVSVELTTIEPIGKIEISSIPTTHHKQLDKQWCYASLAVLLRLHL